MSGVCSDPECNCRDTLVRGWGETEELAITEFVRNALEMWDVEIGETR
jgi:hypothetical protein